MRTKQEYAGYVLPHMPSRPALMSFAELSATSNFTFLTGAAHPEEYIARAAEMGLSAVAIADVNSVAGIVRAHSRAREIARQVAERHRMETRDGMIGPPAPWPTDPRWTCTPRLIPAARLVLREGLEVTALPEDRQGWASLCRLLTLGRRRAPKGDCDLRLADLLEGAAGLHLLLHPGRGHDWPAQAKRLAASHGDRMHLVLRPHYDGRDPVRFDRLAQRAEQLGLPTLAAACPILHRAQRRRLADVLSAIRLGVTVETLGRHALPNAEQRLRSGSEMRRLFAGHDAAIMRAETLAARLTFSLDELRHEYPSEVAGDETPTRRLQRLALAGLDWRYPSGATQRVRDMLAHELALIAKLRYEPYFLTVHDVVAFARSRGILCQGRGSAANSVVCYCLGVTSVSPELGTMVFERFVSEARDEPPDIDVDFEHERREEVIQWIYERYGRHRAGLCATVIHYRTRRAIREVGRAMGLSEDILGAMTSQIWGHGGEGRLDTGRLRELGLDASDPRLALTLELVAEITGFPRHLSQHVGGFVITEGRLDEMVPIENASMADRTVICWDKDDIDALGILKVDVLALGMLTCIRKAFDLLHQHRGQRHTLATLPPEDPKVYAMLARADSLGVFQVESRAQMNFLPRMRPRTFYDLVIQVAIIRPGPIQGDMVHPFIRRRNGEEEVRFPSDELGRVLAKTLGVPLFQEQAMQIAIIGAGFTPDEADRLRRALATFKKHGNVSEFRNRFLKGMRANNYDMEFAERVDIVLVPAYDRDAREHGVTVRPVCINASYWDNTLEPDAQGGLALRLGFRQIKGLARDEADWIAAARGNGYTGPEDVWRRAGLDPVLLARLAEADCFAALGLSRRDALWQAKAIRSPDPLPLFAHDIDGEAINEPAAHLPQMTLGEEMVEDYAALHLSLRAHPLALLRPILTPTDGQGPV